MTSADVVVVGGGLSGYASAAAAAGRGAKVILVEKESEPAFEGSGRAQGSLRLQGRHAAEFTLAQEAIARWQEREQRIRPRASLRREPLPLRRPGGAARSCAPSSRRRTSAGLSDVSLLDRDGDAGDLAAGDRTVRRRDVERIRRPVRSGEVDAGRSTERAHAAGVTTLTNTLAIEGRRARWQRPWPAYDAGLHRGGRRSWSPGGVWTPDFVGTVGVDVPIMPAIDGQAEMGPRTSASSRRCAPTASAAATPGRTARAERRHQRSRRAPASYAATRNAGSGPRATRATAGTCGCASTCADASPAAGPVAPVPRPYPDRHGAAASAPRRRRRGARRAAARAAHVRRPADRALLDRAADISPDGLPIIDHGPDGLVFVTGLSGHGLALGPVLGEITADLALDGRTSRPIRPFRLARFAQERVPTPTKMI